MASVLARWPYFLVKSFQRTVGFPISISPDALWGADKLFYLVREQLTGLSRSQAARVVLFFVLGSLPAFFLFGDIRRTAVNVPFMDDWQFIPLLEKAKNGTLTFQELWAPHDEHRLLLPRIIIIAAMFASKGDYRVQWCISFLAVEIISLCFLWLLVGLNGERFGVWVTWFLANIALFSPIQFQNWLWPMQFAYFLPYTFLALCLCTLCSGRWHAVLLVAQADFGAAPAHCCAEQ
jgi:hypothetical protein